MLRIDTLRGTYYLFDTKNQVARRFPGPGREDWGLDDEVFEYLTPVHVRNPNLGTAPWGKLDDLSQATVGYVLLIDTPMARSPWRITSRVTSVTWTDESFDY